VTTWVTPARGLESSCCDAPQAEVDAFLVHRRKRADSAITQSAYDAR